ncbi:MAG: ATP-binding protein [bacterium]|nr:ATP-binding protein [bacterium]
MKSARIAIPAPEDEPRFVVLAQSAVLKAEPVGPCRRCSPWEDASCNCHRLKKRCTLFNAAMIPAFYIKATLQPLQIHNDSSASLRRTIKAVQQWARRERPPEQGLLLSGPNGVGKSFLMAALARSLTLDRGISCLFVDFGHLLQRLKATFNGQGLEYEVFESLQQPQVLIIDDVGSHRVSTWSRDVFQTIIAARYNACGTTFVTTNLPITSIGTGSFSHFEKWAGPHCTSRLAEMCFWIPVDGTDRRRPPFSRLRPTLPHKA